LTALYRVIEKFYAVLEERDSERMVDKNEFIYILYFVVAELYSGSSEVAVDLKHTMSRQQHSIC
jgi:hypothetical protein